MKCMEVSVSIRRLDLREPVGAKANVQNCSVCNGFLVVNPITSRCDSGSLCAAIVDQGLRSIMWS
jgi:hypothetical protein